MNMKRVVNKNKAVTPVIATMILSAVVIAVGGAIWAYAQGASTVTANSYIDETFDLLDEVIERFMIEHVTNSSDGKNLTVWVYNFGDVDIVVDLYVNTTTYYTFEYNSSVSTGDIESIIVDLTSSPLTSGQEVSIKAHSRRQNNEYYSYIAH
jgi:FlaG/FlaF family flagellin (archaellin)